MFEDLKPHLQDLRKRLIISTLTLLVAFGACFSFWELLFDFVAAPMNKALSNDTINAHLATLSVLEGVFVALKVAFFAALVVSMPVIFWQFWLFVAPGLYKHEKKIVLPFVGFASAMFFVGVAFAYYLVLPVVIENVLLFGNDKFEGSISADNYVMFFTRLVIGFGITFELPVLSYFLARVGMITDKSMKSFFKYAVVIIFVIAALITPPDVISQIFLAIPLIGLYGISILIAKMVNPAKEEAEDLDEDEEEKPDSKE
ncbi:twin-arginine translocase subunit TatC [Helicobacter sp. MIT 00-7814]|uniref:twin-arginine translocase subunit TatC n=1 Tax=unclassified Helicobacter TaxID=2593540 RepID=UPI000E1F613F|nr:MULTISPECIES: twin-arginine translocase subunit TatC [unclassified Helicobacter]RDU55231.1 twin-arginine translocase subunit TatC [Helicobacter sp. MIT 99-10781]RDU56069.1 twin-arginine translocase subunit TatC [Helicobacter sp. MIT 00-7814]